MEGSPPQLPAVLSPSRQLAAYTLNHGSTTDRSHKTTPSQPQPPNFDEPLAANAGSQTRHRRQKSQVPYPTENHDYDEHPPPSASDANRETRSHRRFASIDTSSLDRSKLKLYQKHKHSKSRDGLIPRTMNNIASSASARGLLPTRSGGKERDNDGDEGLLSPVSRETTRSRWGSDSTNGLGPESRKGSLPDGIEQNERLSLIRSQEIHSVQDLQQARDRRKQGEAYLRSALSLVGTLATDMTRRLDYTYYNLLERIASLNSTIASFQELSDSTSTLYDDFERETTGLDQEIRKQLGDLKQFLPQAQKIQALEERMKAGKIKAEALGKRFEAVRDEIDRWEKRETEWQTRVGKRLRIFWGVVTTAILTLVVALVIQKLRTVGSHSVGLPQVFNQSSDSLRHHQDNGESISATDGLRNIETWSQNPPSFASRHTTHQFDSPANTPTSISPKVNVKPTDQDPLRIFDEL